MLKGEELICLTKKKEEKFFSRANFTDSGVSFEQGSLRPTQTTQKWTIYKKME